MLNLELRKVPVLLAIRNEVIKVSSYNQNAQPHSEWQLTNSETPKKKKGKIQMVINLFNNEIYFDPVKMTSDASYPV